MTSAHILNVLSAGIPNGAAAAPVKKLTAAILTGVVGIGLLAWPFAFVAPLRGPTDKAAAPMYFKNILLEILRDITIPSFLVSGFLKSGNQLFPPPS
jgi:hypothetical protein